MDEAHQEPGLLDVLPTLPTRHLMMLTGTPITREASKRPTAPTAQAGEQDGGVCLAPSHHVFRVLVLVPGLTVLLRRPRTWCRCCTPWACPPSPSWRAAPTAWASCSSTPWSGAQTPPLHARRSRREPLRDSARSPAAARGTQPAGSAAATRLWWKASRPIKDWTCQELKDARLLLLTCREGHAALGTALGVLRRYTNSGLTLTGEANLLLPPKKEQVRPGGEGGSRRRGNGASHGDGSLAQLPYQREAVASWYAKRPARRDSCGRGRTLPLLVGSKPARACCACCAGGDGAVGPRRGALPAPARLLQDAGAAAQGRGAGACTGTTGRFTARGQRADISSGREDRAPAQARARAAWRQPRAVAAIPHALAATCRRRSLSCTPARSLCLAFQVSARPVQSGPVLLRPVLPPRHTGGWMARMQRSMCTEVRCAPLLSPNVR